jgi:helix-turn-helix protein
MESYVREAVISGVIVVSKKWEDGWIQEWQNGTADRTVYVSREN